MAMEMLKSKGFLLFLYSFFFVFSTMAAELSGTASVSITSDTAAVAKKMALSEARLQIIKETLGQYTNPEQFEVMMETVKEDDLTPLITSTSIDKEKSSETTYSADITMIINGAAAKKWLKENNVQNWLVVDSFIGDKFLAQIALSGGLVDWMELNEIARKEGIILETKNIYGGQIIVELPASIRSKFTIAVSEAGWNYADEAGILHIWK